MPRRKRGITKSDITTGYPIPATIEVEGRREFCFTLPDDPAYIDAFWYHLEKLGIWVSWEHYVNTGAKDTRAKDVAAWWAENVYLPNRAAFEAELGCGCGDSDISSSGDCVSYPPLLEYFDFYPTNPYAGNTDVSPGYSTNPWRVAKNDAITGIKKGDVYSTVIELLSGVNALNFLPRMLQRLASGGFPRFEFTFEGKGEVELHLLNVPQGGLYLIRDKGNLIETQIAYGSSIDAGQLTSWIDALITLLGLGVTGGIVPEQVIELDFNKSAKHTVEVILLPRINIPNFLDTGWGGGVREIVICGKSVKPQTPKPPVIRPGNGDIEYQNPNTGEWIPIPESGYIIDDCGCCDETDNHQECLDCEEC